MITIGYSTRKHNQSFIDYLTKVSGLPNVEIIEKVNPNGQSLTEVYNEILEESKHDIVILCHDDIYFDTKNFGKKIKTHFENSPYGILGVAGTRCLPSSGMWWEGRKKIIGIVNHEHEGKKWENKYSDNLNNQIRSVVIVDGLFIALDKRRVRKHFDPSVKGFHFYDLEFCFQNYLEGVKLGVVFDVRVTHKSIGMTNDEWETNRKLFSEKHKNQLPVHVDLEPSEKLKILISCLQFKTFTGSELYVFELSKALKSLGHDVTVLSETGGELQKKAEKLGITCIHVKTPPGFKRGDGKTMVQTPQGMVVSQENQLYFQKDVNYDIIFTQHTPVTEYVCNLYPLINKINIIHSEVIDLEKPVKNEFIKRYIAIRPEIKQHLVEVHGIEEDNIDILYNPIDIVRFNTNNVTDLGYTLFVGTIDYLRRETLFDLVEYTKRESRELWIVGENKGDYLSDLLKNPNVKHFDATYNVEKYVKECKETAGILLGRTTIEGWMCGKPGWIYDVDSNGNLLDKTLHQVPSDLEKYNPIEIAKYLINIKTL